MTPPGRNPEPATQCNPEPATQCNLEPATQWNPEPATQAPLIQSPPPTVAVPLPLPLAVSPYGTFLHFKAVSQLLKAEC